MKLLSKKRLAQAPAACLVLLALLFPLSGCSTISGLEKSTDYFIHDMTGPDRSLKRKAVFAAFTNQSGIPGLNAATLLSDPIQKELREDCPQCLLLADTGLEQTVLRNLTLPTGLSENLSVMEKARGAGASAVIAGTLWGVTQSEKAGGIAGFRKKKQKATATVLVWVYDTLTGAKIMDHAMTREVDLPKGFQGIFPEKEWEEIAMDAAREICHSVRTNPWRGYVTSVAGDRVTLSSGRDSGLSPGDEFGVYEPGTVVKGVEGEEYLIPGKRIAGIEVETLAPETATAVVVPEEKTGAEGEDAEAGGRVIKPGYWVSAD